MLRGAAAADAYEATSPENQRERALWQRIQNKARRKAAAEATSPEDQAQIDATHEALRAAERERKARERLGRSSSGYTTRRAATRPN